MTLAVAPWLWLIGRGFGWLIEWPWRCLIGWLAEWPWLRGSCWLTRLTDWPWLMLIGWLAVAMWAWLLGCLTDWSWLWLIRLIGWLVAEALSDWLNCRGSAWLTEWPWLCRVDSSLLAPQLLCSGITMLLTISISWSLLVSADHR